MARTSTSPQQQLPTGIVPTYVAADNANGQALQANNGYCTMRVKNANAGSLTATVRANGSKVSGVTIPDVAIVLGTGTESDAGPFDPQYFNQSDGSVNVDWSLGASVTFSWMKLK